ncbi:MAG: ABC transporter ATP-binding protein [Pseudomonadota bacterium]
MNSAGPNAISLTEVEKSYRFYDRPLDRLREVLFRTPRHRLHQALGQVTLDIPRGETFGLVGENGAGKSTFLKLVAGTILPTAGSLRVEGRVAALLELGAGFHPEETGRDNVMLMAALNGVPSHGMSDYYTKVTEFAELPEEVLQRPVKTYSSGMFMRLAFSAATAVDPDILVIDEALSVGDMHFQKKSLDRIMQFREAGKTVLFCSHNLYQVRSLCTRAAWVHQGRIMALGDTENVVTAYESHERAKEQASREFIPSTAEHATTTSSLAPIRFIDVTLETPDGINPAYVETYQPVRLIIEVESHRDDHPFHVGFAIIRNDKENVFGTSTHFARPQPPMRGTGRHRIALRFPSFPLLSGDYLLSVYVLDDTGLQVIDMAESIRPFRVHHRGREFGFVHIPHEWESPA